MICWLMLSIAISRSHPWSNPNGVLCKRHWERESRKPYLCFHCWQISTVSIQQLQQIFASSMAMPWPSSMTRSMRLSLLPRDFKLHSWSSSLKPSHCLMSTGTMSGRSTMCHSRRILCDWNYATWLIMLLWAGPAIHSLPESLKCWHLSFWDSNTIQRFILT